MEEISDICEELFCLKFELDSLSEVLIKQESERWLPGFTYEFVHDDHMKRYELACEFVKGKKVLDIACGAGKGSFLMAENGATLVDGCDINQNAIRYASHRNKKNNIDFKIQNALEFTKLNEYDVAVSFETIEHLPNAELFFNNISNALREKGLFLISTPISQFNLDSRPNNPYHIQEWGFEAFHRLIEKYFIIEKVYIQLYPYRADFKPLSINQRIFNKFFRKKPKQTSSIVNKSTIEEYNGQYHVKELGNQRIGYQIVICSKK